MQILAVDIGTGTQDILLFQTTEEPENALKMIMPSPTLRLARAIREGTAAGADLLLTGVTMGGGPCAWAAKEHLKAGYRVYATADAACTFDDDLDAVAEMGVQIVSEDEALHLRHVQSLVTRDLDLDAIRAAFSAFGVTVEPDALGVAVFDHGAAPPGVSDRRFRFEYLAGQLTADPHLTTLAFSSLAVPEHLTRMRAVVSDCRPQIPTLLMDTPSAAVLGAREDPVVRQADPCIAVNIGNAHTLAFRLQGDVITGLFEHHTGKLTCSKLDALIDELAAGTLENDAVYRDHGHGALILDDRPLEAPLVSVTGPRRALLKASRHRPYFAVPYGDMMLAGCWGLVRALAAHKPAMAEDIQRGLALGQ